ncbi:MAG: sugar transferase [Nitrospirae bacterium]|nr:sugar transferase [Nitrospirota bacterium]
MLKEQERFIHKINMAIDSFAVAGAFLLAFILRDNLQYLHSETFEFLHEMPPFKDYAWVMVIAVPLWIISLSHFGMYHSLREKRFRDVFWSIFDASLFAVLIFSAVAFLLKLEFISRTFTVILFVCAIFMLFAEKVLVLSLLYYLRQRGYNYRVLLIAGSGERANNFADIIRAHPHWGVKILGFVDEEERVGMRVGNDKVIGSFNDIAKILDENVVDEVVFILPIKWLSNLEGYIKVCENVGVKATIAADFFNMGIAKPRITEIHDWPFLIYETTPHNVLDLFSKRLLDIVISGCGLILLSPFFLITSLIIKITSKGPAFFKQIRCGLHGREFTVYKFRTMVIDAEERLKELMKFNEREGPIFKMKNDPRITGIGKFLRKTSLDELPQLINVFKGDMSLVGPRPPIPMEVAKYERWQRRKLSLRPGITCIHEVVARNDKDFERWMKLDLEYIDNWSMSLDVKILTRTILAVFRGTGC